MMGLGMENFAVMNERGALFGPFDTIIGAQAWADEELGVEHGYKILKLIKPKLLQRSQFTGRLVTQGETDDLIKRR